MNFHKRVKLAWRVIRAKSGNCASHAEREMLHWRKSDDPMSRAMADDLAELILVFGTQGHSGFSASYAISCFKTLAAFKPLGPLTGDPLEWNEVGDNQYQNNRCSTVFKSGADGEAYDIDGVVFEEPNGCRFTCFLSRTPVVFPYVQKTAIAKVSENSSDEEREQAKALALSASC
jgi:hypothetical protein